MHEPILSAVNLTRRFRTADSKHRVFTAVDSASLSIFPGETVGLLGESGSGKSTLGQMLTGLLRPDGGEVRYRGAAIRYPFRGQTRRCIQILFQHPEVSFNPMLTLRQSLVEPFRLRKLPCTDADLVRCIARFGLHPEHLSRLPGELSGGELQRAALARVLVMTPEVILLDEPTSMLDVVTQAQIIELLRGVQQRKQTGYLFITHSRLLARAFCHRICYIDKGRIIGEETVK